jgi:hypothetical protein
VNLNISTSLNTDVFMGSVFYSLQAVLGGAIYTNTNASVRNCRFANNSADNGDGNDIYVSVSSSFYNNNDNIQNTCSLSLLPGRLKTSDVFFFFFFLILINTLFFFFLIRLLMIICSLQQVVIYFHVEVLKKQTPRFILVCAIAI